MCIFWTPPCWVTVLDPMDLSDKCDGRKDLTPKLLPACKYRRGTRRANGHCSSFPALHRSLWLRPHSRMPVWSDTTGLQAILSCFSQPYAQDLLPQEERKGTITRRTMSLVTTSEWYFNTNHTSVWLDRDSSTGQFLQNRRHFDQSLITAVVSSCHWYG